MSHPHYETLYKSGLEFAVQNMESEDGFIPFAITLDEAGEKRLLLPGPDETVPDTLGQVELLERMLAQRVEQGLIAACALVTDVSLRHPETDDRLDAIAIDIDSSLGGAGRLIFPYVLDDGAVRVGKASMAPARVKFIQRVAPVERAASEVPRSLLGRVFRGFGRK